MMLYIAIDKPVAIGAVNIMTIMYIVVIFFISFQDFIKIIIRGAYGNIK